MSIPAPSMQDLMALLDLRERFEEFFETAGQAWPDRQIATNPEFAHVTRKTGYVVEYDRDVLVYSYYPDAWHSRNEATQEIRIPLGEFVPGYDQRMWIETVGFEDLRAEIRARQQAQAFQSV